MKLLQIAVAAALVAAAPVAGARAQAPPCRFFPLCIPFVVVGTAAAVATAPLRAIARPYPPPYYYYRPAPGYYPYSGYGYGGPGYYGRPY